MTADPRSDQYKPQIGDIVTLRSGGPQMVVDETRALEEYDAVDVAWFDGTVLNRQSFSAKCLRLVAAWPNEPKIPTKAG